jgi:DNA-binding transcriptional MerR regulator
MQMQHILEIRAMSQDQGFTISQVAHLTGVKAKTIRYYESVGLLPRPARFANRYRRYCQADINRLLLLRCIRSLGIPLAQARQLLMEASDARCLDVQQEILRLLNARLIALSQEIAELRQLQSQIEEYRQTLASCPPGEDEQFKNCVNMSCCLEPQVS